MRKAAKKIQSEVLFCDLRIQELIRVLYNDSVELNSLKDLSLLPGDASAVADSSRGVRSIMVHRNGQHLAIGDREGNLRLVVSNMPRTCP